MKIYIVIGSTGEYSDHVEWFLKAFKSEQNAKNLVLKVSERARELMAFIDADKRSYLEIPKGSNEFDPQMQVDYSGVNYNIQEVEYDDSGRMFK